MYRINTSKCDPSLQYAFAFVYLYLCDSRPIDSDDQSHAGKAFRSAMVDRDDIERLLRLKKSAEAGARSACLKRTRLEQEQKHLEQELVRLANLETTIQAHEPW